jgi:hypothetical protein
VGSMHSSLNSDSIQFGRFVAAVGLLGLLRRRRSFKPYDPDDVAGICCPYLHERCHVSHSTRANTMAYILSEHTSWKQRSI